MPLSDLAEISRLLAREEALLRSAFRRFFVRARAPATLARITRALRAHNTGAALGVIDDHIQEFADQLPKTFVRAARWEMQRIKRLLHHRKLLRLVGKSALRKADGDLELGIDLSFDPNDEDAALQIEQMGFEFLRDFNAKQKRALRAALSRAQREGLGTAETARMIRDSIGLTETQWNAVNNYRDMLAGSSGEALNRQLRDRRFDNTVQNAIDRGDILTSEQIDRMVDRYTDRMLDYRANNIARTESHRAMSAGRNAAWKQTADQLGLEDDQVIRTWNTTKDGRERDTHHEMDGQTVIGFEPFESPSGALLLYPGDPSAPAEEVVQCRCVESYGFA